MLTTDDLVAGEDVFVAATGVTSGALLRGVRYTQDKVITESMVMRSRSGTVRGVEAEHAFEKLAPVGPRLPLDRRGLHLRRGFERAALFNFARRRYACWPASTFEPDHAFSAGACNARPYENESSHGCGPRAFIALRCAVVLVRLAAREEHDPGDRSRDVAREDIEVRSATSSAPARPTPRSRT